MTNLKLKNLLFLRDIIRLKYLKDEYMEIYQIV